MKQHDKAMQTIHASVKAGDISAVASQLELGAAVDARDADNRTPLMIAATSDAASATMVRLLIEHGADVNAVEPEENYSVLALAVQAGTLDKIETLLNGGADIHYQREGGYNVLIDAMHSQAMVDKTPLLPLVDLLLSHGAPTQGESDWGESALSVSSHIGRFDVVARLLEAGADEDLLGWNELMRAVALGSAAEVQRLIENGADLTARDRWERTAWLLSLETGDLEKAQLLLSTGGEVHERGHCGQTPLMHAIEKGREDVVLWLIAHGADIEAKDDFGGTALMKAAEEGATECVRYLLEAGAKAGETDWTETKAEDTRAMFEEINLELEDSFDLDLDRIDFDSFPSEAAIAKATNLDIVRFLVAAGEDLGDISDEMRAELTGLETEGEIVCSKDEYIAGKYRRFGTTNPEVMNVPFWSAMVRSGLPAYSARAAFDDTGNYADEPVWCFHRFGKSITELPDGRIIEIGGEHEDSYDTDFCIYNEVFVHYGGGRFEIYGYPQEVFPPTDFHSATLVGDYIYIIGCLGYPEERRSGETPVYRLNCETLAMESVATSGDKPGWINGHKAVYHGSDSHTGDAGTGVISISGGKVWKTVRRKVIQKEETYEDNPDSYILNLADMTWSRAPASR